MEINKLTISVAEKSREMQYGPRERVESVIALMVFIFTKTLLPSYY